MRTPSLKQAFQKHLERRYSLRLHMCLILLATTLSGILFSKLLLIFEVVDFRIRYPLSVLIAYSIFFACVRLWLYCVSSLDRKDPSAADWLGFSIPSSGDGISKDIPLFRGGGGQFLGAGDSGAFENPDLVLVETTALADPQSTVGGDTPKAIEAAVGKASGALGHDNILVVVIVLLVLVGTILVSIVLLIYGAPTILGEAAFEGVLAAALIKRARAICDKAWAGSILKATWKPFASTMVVAFFSGLVLHSFFPKAVRLGDILWKG